jgi:tetraacyldisaccharide 4'-kinase
MRWPASGTRSAFSGPWKTWVWIAKPGPFPDHHRYSANDLAFAGRWHPADDREGCSKMRGLTAAEAWVLPVEAELAPALIELILEKLRGRQAA